MLPIKKLMRNMAIAGCLMGSSAAAMAGTFVGDRTDFRDETIYFTITTRFYDAKAS